MSLLGNIVAITRLITRLNDEKLDLFKQHLFQHFECENERLFLSKVLTSMCSQLTEKSLTSLKDTIIQLADTQNDTENSQITTYKKMQHECLCDPISNLPSDTIDNIAMFLNKQESIELGYINRQLYIESQKTSYLAKRCHDPPLIIRDSTLNKILNDARIRHTPAMPSKLRIEARSLYKDPYKQLSKTKWFRIMFSRLKSLHYNNFCCLSYIPVELLFKKHNMLNYYQDDELDELSFEFESGVNLEPELGGQVFIFGNKYQKMLNENTNKNKTNNTNKNNNNNSNDNKNERNYHDNEYDASGDIGNNISINKVREIKKLVLIDTYGGHAQQIRIVLKSLCPNYRHLLISSQCIRIGTFNHLLRLVHQDLESFKLSLCQHYSISTGKIYDQALKIVTANININHETNDIDSTNNTNNTNNTNHNDENIDSGNVNVGNGNDNDNGNDNGNTNGNGTNNSRNYKSTTSSNCNYNKPKMPLDIYGGDNELIKIEFDRCEGDVCRTILNLFGNYNLMQNIECIAVDIRRDPNQTRRTLQGVIHWFNFERLEFNDKKLLDEILFDENGRYPYLNKVVITMRDNRSYLETYIALSLYLIEKFNSITDDFHYELMNEIEIIEIKLVFTTFHLKFAPLSSKSDLFNMNHVENIHILDEKMDTDYTAKMIKEMTNKENENEIIIEWDCDLTCKGFGVMYQNLINLCRRLESNQTTFGGMQQNTIVLRCNIT